MCSVTFRKDPDFPPVETKQNSSDFLESTSEQLKNNLTQQELKERLSENDYKEYARAKSNISFSISLIKGGKLDERGMEIHKQNIANLSKQITDLTKKALNAPIKDSPATKMKNPKSKTDGYMINSISNSNSEVKITKEQFDNVIAHQKKRINNKIEYGNVIDNHTGKLVHSEDIKGKKNTVKVPTYNKPYSVIHNHTNNGGLSGGDAFSHLTNNNQEVCYATTPKGIWIMRDTKQSSYSKKGYGLSENSAYEIKYNMEGHYREISKQIYNSKYKSLLENAQNKKEFNKIRDDYANECFEKYNKFLLDKYGAGKNSLIEIDFVPIEEVKYVKF